MTHNSAGSVEALLNHVLQQLRPTGELVVVDNASSDDTPGRAAAAPIACRRSKTT
jgi:glycosyltransferase involved in cell wall biosynthesis